jgi:rhamnulose-1-phosphate aldolase/alcohol dehydrogenase
MNPSNELLPSLWSAAAPLDPVDALVYSSNLLGSDPRITNFGGGNTSVKVESTDPLTGQGTEVLWVKGSGGDLGSAKKSGFASLYLDKVLSLEARYQGGRTHQGELDEDEIVELYRYSVFANNPAAPSIDTPLHAFVPSRCVSHMHSDAVIAIAASADAEALMHEIYAGEMGYLRWKRPGLELGLMLRDLIEREPGIHSALMGQHGFICWADTWAECYELTLTLINRAQAYLSSHRRGHPFGESIEFTDGIGNGEVVDFLPKLRGKVAFNGVRSIAHFDSSEPVLEFLSREKSDRLIRLGTSCPDHFLRTKIRPMVLDSLDDDHVEERLAGFRKEYEAYYLRCRHDSSPAMRNPNPSIVLIPGVGMVSFGKSAAEARIAGEFYRNAINVMHGAETVSQYVALPEQEAFDIEYWLLEEAKLKRQPPEAEFSRQISLVIGAGPGIGREIAEKLLAAGSVVVVADRNPALVEDASAALRLRYGNDVVMGVELDITDRASVHEALSKVILRYGGIDVLINIAAVFIPPTPDGTLTDAQWRATYDINVVGSFIVADEAAKVMSRQRTPASLVLVSSANAVVPKRGSVAYDTSKSAVNHLVRELAIEHAPTIRVNAVAPATVVSGSQMFPRDRVIASLTKYEIGFEEGESDEELRGHLAQFYAKRTLLKQPVLPGKVADAAVLLAGSALSQTTGQVISVDAGIPEAFLR